MMTSLRFGVVTLLSVLLFGCSASPPSSGDAATHLGTLYVSNETSGDISVVDVATEKVIATVPVGKRPRGLAANRNGSLVYVALSGSPIAGPGVDEDTLPPPDRRADGIGVVDVHTRRLVKILPSGSDPEQVAVGADGRMLFIANEDASQTTVLDADSGQRIATVGVGGEPEGVNVRPDGKEVWVTSESDNAVFVIDTEQPRVLHKIDVGPRPRSTTFSADSARAYVPSENGASVSIIDTVAHRVTGLIALSGDLQRPMGGVISRDQRTLFMTTGRGKTVAVIDLDTNRHVASVEVGERPWGIAYAAGPQLVFTANGPSNDITVIDAVKHVVKRRVKVGEGPWGVVYLE